MDSFLNIGALPLIMLFVLPGLISMQVYRMVMPAYRIQWQSAPLEAFFYSTINFAILSPFLILIHRPGVSESYPLVYAFFWGIALFIAPIAWPIGLRWVVRNTKLMRQLQLPYPTAWDYYFDKRRRAFVLVRMHDGTLIGGYFGDDSYATSYPNDGDLYLEIVYKVNDDGTFGEPIDESDGTLIRRGSFDTVEFFRPSKATHLN